MTKKEMKVSNYPPGYDEDDHGNIIHADDVWLTRVLSGEIGLEKAQVEHIEQTPIEKLWEIQDKPWYEDNDYLPEDAGMWAEKDDPYNKGDNERNE